MGGADRFADFPVSLAGIGVGFTGTLDSAEDAGELGAFGHRRRIRPDVLAACLSTCSRSGAWGSYRSGVPQRLHVGGGFHSMREPSRTRSGCG